MIKKPRSTFWTAGDLYSITIIDTPAEQCSLMSYVAASRKPIRYLKPPYTQKTRIDHAKFIESVMVQMPQLANKQGDEYIVGGDMANPTTSDCWFIIKIYYRYKYDHKSVIIASNGIDDYLCRSISDCKLVFTEGLKDCIRRAITSFVNSFVKN